MIPKIESMDNEFADVMSKGTDAELLEVLNSHFGDYQPSALEAAKTEFKKRNLSKEQMLSAEVVIKHKQELQYKLSNEPLSIAGNTYAFIFPRFFSTLLWRSYLAKGQEQKYKERMRSQLYGICFYVVSF